MKSLIIFDLDGTLAESNSDHESNPRLSLHQRLWLAPACAQKTYAASFVTTASID
jgi:hydroxymethylpyrimidine pyrophosphatase-like HAD family hydrolase